MNLNMFYQGVNLKIVRNLNVGTPVLFQDYGDDAVSIFFPYVCAIVPKDILSVDISKLRRTRIPDVPSIYHAAQKKGWDFYQDIERLNKDYFFGRQSLFFIEDFGSFKGLTFENSRAVDIDGTFWIAVFDYRRHPLALLRCGGVWGLTPKWQAPLTKAIEG